MCTFFCCCLIACKARLSDCSVLAADGDVLFSCKVHQFVKFSMRKLGSLSYLLYFCTKNESTGYRHEDYDNQE